MPQTKQEKKIHAMSKKSSGSGKGKPFGGYKISFAGRDETIEDVFGDQPLAPSEMTKELWKFIKGKKLNN